MSEKPIRFALVTWLGRLVRAIPFHSLARCHRDSPIRDPNHDPISCVSNPAACSGGPPDMNRSIAPRTNWLAIARLT